ncbi:MAG: class I SAM-dependent methyltransferase [Xenococcaceae cyanobacterium]
MSEHTGKTYEDIAAKYADTIDNKPMTIFYERPAFVSLLPKVWQKNVLDVGCGSGWYSEYLLNEGATVTAFDFNKEFVKRTRERVENRAQVLQANLAEPLAFAKDAEFDLIICPLVMHYIKAWQPVFQEFHRVLKPKGILVFSTHHPFTDWQEFKTENYFAVDLIEDEWDVGKVEFYRRPITVMSEDLEAAGFVIERLLEPQPLELLREANSELFEHLMKKPWRLMIRACKQTV